MSFVATSLVAAHLLSAATGTANFGMAISPASVTGPSSSVAQFTVTDVGKSPISVRIQAIELRPIAGHPHSFAPYGEYGQAKVSAEKFTLKPGQFKVVKVTIKATDSYRHDLGVSATGQVASVKQGASVQTAAIARYTVNPSGQAQPDHSKPIVAENHAQDHGSPLVPLGIAASLILAIGYLTRRVIKRFRKAKVNAS